MKLLKEIGILLTFAFLGDFISSVAHIPIPGNVMGMLILLVMLFIGVIKTDALEQVEKFFLSNLAFLFIPSGVGLIKVFGVVKNDLMTIMTIIIITTLIVLVISGWTVQLLQKVVDKYAH